MEIALFLWPIIVSYMWRFFLEPSAISTCVVLVFRPAVRGRAASARSHLRPSCLPLPLLLLFPFPHRLCLPPLLSCRLWRRLYAHHNKRKMANEALREKEALADDRRRRDVAEALRLRDHERERAEGEASLRSDLETELQRIREELADSRAGREEARVNLGVVAAACREAEAKSRELQEHRRVLAREVNIFWGAWRAVGRARQTRSTRFWIFGLHVLHTQ